MPPGPKKMLKLKVIKMKKAKVDQMKKQLAKDSAKPQGAIFINDSHT